MDKIFNGNIHFGISNLKIEENSFDLGDGIIISKTYAHLMSPFIVAFQPAPPGKHHPAPWKSTYGGNSFDINAELFIPSHIEEKYESKIEVARTIGFLFRLGINPATQFTVFSNHSFSELPKIPDSESIICPFDTQTRYFMLSVESENTNTNALKWLAERWQTVHKLTKEKNEFALAVNAIDTGQFIQNSGLTMVLLWGALESLFSPSTSELRFRVSSLIAAYLEKPGIERVKRQKEVSKLYDKRSAAAHGKPKHNSDDLLRTFNLLRDVVWKIIDDKKVPRKKDLENLLFGIELDKDD